MKTKRLLTPLALAIATTLSAGAYAQGFDGSSATIDDTQVSTNNDILNQATDNDAVVEGSLDSASGNVGINVAAGNNNQQANAAAVSTADAFFVFGVPVAANANASIQVSQLSQDNTVTNYSTPNNASLVDSAGGASGNIGMNIAAGDYNQQKNDMAVANSENAINAGASVTVSQTSQNNLTNNYATLEYGSQQVSLTLNGGGTYDGQSDQIGDVYPDIWTGASHPSGSPAGHFDLDTATQGGSDLNDDGGALAFNEAGTLDLEGTVSGSIPILVGFADPAVNNASLTNSLGGASGNVGVNIAAGAGNQQSNSLAIAAGCNACVPTAPPTVPGE
ncbi:hypothetical protein [Halopseudomonas sp.]|uniref:hypothetical protein n=1 Tax=Halopseudomonas sp. TaxID=2901191 RepID=UPI0035699D6E